MKKNLISIIIPYCKKKDYFQQTIDSIQNQTYKNFELIIIYDDIDRSDLNFVKKVIKKLKRKKLIINRFNIGAGLSRNKGIKFSKGEFIAFCDADDLWIKKKLEVQFQFMKKNKLSFSHSSYDIINMNGLKISSFNIKETIKFHNLIRSCDIGLSSVMCSKKILKENFFLNTKTKEDYYLWLNIIKDINKFKGIKRKLVLWRKLNNSLSSSTFRGFIDAFIMYKAYTKSKIIMSAFYTLRLSFNVLIKKLKLYL